MTKGQVLNRGACAGFTSYFRSNPNCAADATTFKAAVVAGPPPSAACAHTLDSPPTGPACKGLDVQHLLNLLMGLVTCAPARPCSR